MNCNTEQKEKKINIFATLKWMEECREDEIVRNVLKVSELDYNGVKERAYQESSRGKYEVWRGEEVESVEKEWEKFREIVMECTNDVCNMRHVGGQRRKRSECWNKKWVGLWPKREQLLWNGF